MKFNRILNTIVLSTLVMAVTTGCSDDLGNYDYVPVNEVSVGGSDSDDIEELVSGKTYNVVAHVDHLRFSPTLSSTFGITDDARYEFEWRVVAQGAETDKIDPEEIVVCRERCIDIPVTLAATTYNCFFNVKDKDTGITWSTPFYLQVRSLTGEGWFVLCDDHDWSRIDIIFNKDENEDIIARDILGGQEFDPGKPERLIFNYWRYGSEVALLVTDKDTYILDNEDLHVGEDNRLAWQFGIVPDKMRIKASAKSIYAMRNLWVIIDEDDEVYTLDLKTSGSFFEYPVTKINGTEPFTPAPFVGVNLNNSSWMEDMENCNPVVLYDETHSQFLTITNTSNYPQVMEFTGTKLFDNPTDGRRMVWMENTHPGIIKSVLRDPSNGETYYYGISLHAETIEGANWWDDPEIVPYNKQAGYCRIIGPGVERAEKFTFHGLFPYMFYTVDNKIYQFNLGEPDVPAVEVLSFPGEEVAEMKFVPFVGWNPYQDWERQREYDLVVGTNDMSLDESDRGTVRFYDVPNLMKPLSLKKEVSDFGHIKEIIYKERKR